MKNEELWCALARTGRKTPCLAGRCLFPIAANGRTAIPNSEFLIPNS